MEKYPKISLDQIETKKEASQAIDNLREAIRYHDYRYYVQDDPAIADADYDRLMAELQELEDRYTDLITPDSPTQKVPGKPQEELGTLKHPAPMLSLQAVYEVDEVRDFVRQCQESLDVKELDFVAEPKYDGASIELIYQNGSLEAAATRGDGETGENVTANLKTIKGLPLKLTSQDSRPIPRRLVVRGEVYMRKDEFAELNKRRGKNGESQFANPRNAAAGSLRQLDPAVTARRPLHIFLYQIAECKGCGDLAAHWDCLQALAAWGLRTNLELSRRCKGVDDLLEYHADLEDCREDLPYEIDGVVFKVDRLESQKSLGTRSRNPRWALAYKFEPRRAGTQIEDIQVQVGRTGKLTPVALLKPVHIGGVEISRASLHNQSEIERKDIRIGDHVLIERAGDVIPQVVKSLPDRRDGSERKFHMPEKCPACGGEVVTSEDKKQAYCTNLGCPAQLRERVQHFTSRQAMDIEGLGEKRAGQLVEQGLVKSLSSLYHLNLDDLASLEGYAQKSAQNLLDEIEASKDQTLLRFLYALGIPLVGEHIAHVLAENYQSLDDLMEASQGELEEIPEIGPEVASSLRAFLSQDQNRKEIQEIRSAGLNLTNPLYGQGGGALDGVTFVFTGSLEKWSRDEAERLVERLGGRATSSVSGNTDYVVAGPGAGSKLEEAHEQDVPVMDEEEFSRFLDERRS